MTLDVTASTDLDKSGAAGDRRARQNLTIDAGSDLVAPPGSLILGQGFTVDGGFDANGGTVVVDNSPCLELGDGVTFFDLTIASGENVFVNDATGTSTVAGTLTNLSTLNEFRAVSAPGPITFGLLNVGMDVIDNTDLTEIQIAQTDTNPPGVADPEFNQGVLGHHHQRPHVRGGRDTAARRSAGHERVRDPRQRRG